MTETHAATITDEGEDFVTVVTAEGAKFNLRYWAVPAAFTTGDAVTLVVESVVATRGPLNPDAEGDTVGELYPATSYKVAKAYVARA